MMNYIAMQLASFFIIYLGGAQGRRYRSASSTRSTRAGWLPELSGSAYLLNIV